MLMLAAMILLIPAAAARALRHGFYLLHVVLALATFGALSGTAPVGFAVTASAIANFLLIHLFWINVVTFLAYCYDKSAARRQKWRVPERTLHALAILGGTPGGFAGSRLFHHKTRKARFRVVFWLVAALQLFVAAMCYHLGGIRLP